MRSFLSVIALTASTLAGAGPLDDLVDDDWTQVDSRHFKLVTDQPEATARRMLTDLETLRYISTRVRDVEPLEVAQPLTILAVGKRGSFRKLGLRDSVGGMFSIGRDGYSALANVSDYLSSTEESTPARTILLHEYHHFLMRLTLRTLAMPLWYDEGLAEYWSSLTIENGMAKFGMPVDGMHREAWLFSEGGFLRVDTRALFERREFSWDNSMSDNDAIGRFYAQARYTVHYFLSTPQLRAQLDRYIDLFNQGVSAEKAAQLAFKLPYDALDKEVRRYLKHKVVVRGFKIGKGGLEFPPIEMRVSKLDKNATWAVFAEVLPRHIRKNQHLVRTLLDTNRKRNPDKPDAYRLHFTHLGGDGQPGPDELVKRFPTHAGLHAMYGESLRAYGEAQRAAGLDGWTGQLQQARQAHLRAYQLDPRQSLPYYGLGEIHYALAGNDGLNEGIAGLDTAVIYERTPDAFRKLARLHLRAGNMANALTAMRGAVAFNEDKHVNALDIALQENLELLVGPSAPNATATPTGLAWPDGGSYTGPVSGGKPAGSGRYTRVSGSWYEGGFADGLPHGQGKLVSERGVSFEGNFDQGVARGKGKLSVAGGGPLLDYEGEVEHMLPSGSGVLLLDTGRYEGQLREGLPHGSGSFTPAAAPAKLSGTWRFGLFDFPAAGNVLFTGPVNRRGERDGKGWCRPVGQPQEIDSCHYRDGKPAEAPDSET